jgi:hypothetical protein
MRRTGFLAGLATLALTIATVHAQRTFNNGSNDQGGVVFHGVPASVTSIRPDNPTPGVPASVTSPTPAPNSQFNRPIARTVGMAPGFHHHHHVVTVPVAVPVYYPYPVADDSANSDQQQQQPEQPAETEAPAPTIFESRPGYQPPPIKSYQSSMGPVPGNQADNSTVAPAPNQPAANQVTDNAGSTPASEPEPATILVFRDGHQLEIGNYAIVGDTLYNLAGSYKTHKILLADLDLDKTAKLNEERGYEFRLPKQPGN